MPAPAMLKAMPSPPPPPTDEEEFVSAAPEADMHPEPDTIARVGDVQGRAHDTEDALHPLSPREGDIHHLKIQQQDTTVGSAPDDVSENGSPIAQMSSADPENAPMMQETNLAKTLLEQRQPQNAEHQPSFTKDNVKGTTNLLLDNSETNIDTVKQLVTSFAQEAVRGSFCTCVRVGSLAPVRFLLDRKLDNLSVVATGECLEQIMTCELTSVDDIYSFSEDGDSAFQPDILNDLDEDARELLVMVALRGNPCGFKELNLLLSTCESRDKFLMGMKVLVEGKRSQLCSSSKSTLGNVPTGAGPAIAARSFLRELGVRALQSVPRSPLWRTTAEVAPYLSRYGYTAIDHTNWKTFGSGVDRHPVLSFRVAQHVEAARHTWYIVESRVGLQEEQHTEWLAPRRLEHLRKDLHDIVKSALGQNAYGKCFDGARFAPHGGLPGTTAHLRRWFDALASCINSRVAPPLVVAVTFRFLEAPNSD